MKRLTATSDSKKLLVKKLDSDWVKTLADRGQPLSPRRQDSRSQARSACWFSKQWCFDEKGQTWEARQGEG